jgi:DNA-directed RNA polymerase specialized sigma24 family protein
MSGDETSRASDPALPDRFAATRWTLVLRARGDSAESRAALSELCEGYYAPVLAFIRREGRDEDSARDLTQAFFARLLAAGGLKTIEPGHGRFRSYLLGAVKHFLADDRARAQAARRGGGQAALSIEGGVSSDTGIQIPDPAAVAPDSLFDRQWAFTVVGRAVEAVARESAAAGRSEQFRVLKPWLLGDLEHVSQAEAGRQLDLTEGAVKVAIHRLRRRFRELVRAEIAQTVSDPELVQEELRYLLEVLCADPRA